MTGGTSRTLGDRFDAGDTLGFDYLRLVLASAILVWHSYPISFGLASSGHPAALALAKTVVPLFFGLSGFLVASSLERTRGLGAFLLARAFRVLPALAASVLFAALLLGPLVTRLPLKDYVSHPEFAAYFLNAAGIMHFPLPGVFEGNPLPRVVNGSLWTIPWELVAYAGLAALAFARLFKLWALAALLIALTGWQLADPPQHVAGGLGAPGSVLVTTFVAGALLYRLRRRVPAYPLLALAAVLAGAALLSQAAVSALAALPIAYGSVALGCTRPASTALVRTGDYSYGIYLFAFPIQQLVASGPGAGHPWLSLAATIPLTGLAAYLSWHLIEGPALALKKRLVGSGRAARGGAGEAAKREVVPRDGIEPPTP